jgi:hypothetical protein
VREDGRAWHVRHERTHVLLVHGQPVAALVIPKPQRRLACEFAVAMVAASVAVAVALARAAAAAGAVGLQLEAEGTGLAFAWHRTAARPLGSALLLLLRLLLLLLLLLLPLLPLSPSCSCVWRASFAIFCREFL